MNSLDYAIETRDLRKVYPGGKVAVDHLTISVGRGEVYGFLGPNGAGKTTSIKMLTGLVHPSAGSARIFGQPAQSPQARRQVGFLPEQFRFHDWLKADEFLRWHGQLYGMTRARVEQRIPMVLEQVGLAANARQRLSTFSKGMLQRVGLAQALLNEPLLVLLDEPTSALDPIGRRDVRLLISELRRQGTTVFLNSHLLTEVESVCDRLAIIHHGVVLREGHINDLLPPGLEVELRVGGLTEPLQAALRAATLSYTQQGESLQVSIEHEEELPHLAQLVAEHGARLYQLTPRRRNLEELFLNVVALEDGS